MHVFGSQSNVTWQNVVTQIVHELAHQAEYRGLDEDSPNELASSDQSVANRNYQAALGWGREGWDGCGCSSRRVGPVE